MKFRLSCTTIICFFIAITTFAQQSYKGQMNLKLGQTFNGDITVNLGGANNELIEIKTTEKTKIKGGKQTLTTTAKYNVAIISNIVVKKQTYYFRDIKIGYNDSMLNNVCVKLIYGTLDCGIFKVGDGKEINSIAIKFPKEEFSKLVSIDFDYYNTSQSVLMRISDCEMLLQKMMDNDPTVTWTENATQEQRFLCFKNIIDAYNKCKKRN